jgi:hypothetical protein
MINRYTFMMKTYATKKQQAMNGPADEQEAPLGVRYE